MIPRCKTCGVVYELTHNCMPQEIKKNECCEKCFIDKPTQQKFNTFCGNSCPCHSQEKKEDCHKWTTKDDARFCYLCGQRYFIEKQSPLTDINTGTYQGAKSPQEKKIQAAAKDFAERFEPVMKELAEEESSKECKGCKEYGNRPGCYTCSPNQYEKRCIICGHTHELKESSCEKLFLSNKLTEEDKAELVKLVRRNKEIIDAHTSPSTKDIGHEKCKTAIKEGIQRGYDEGRLAVLEELQEKIEKELPQAWFPGGALDQKKKWLMFVLSIINELKPKQ